MEKRIIKIKTDEQAQLISVETSATTLGELKNEFDINWQDVYVVVKDTKTSLPFNESMLPQGNSILFVFPKKAKSGAYGYKEAKAKIKALRESGVIIPFNYTRATTEAMNDFLTKYEANTTPTKKVNETKMVKEEESIETTIINLEAGKKYLLIVEGNMTREVVVEKIPEGYVSTKILVDTTTIDELNQEYASLKERI